MTAAVLCACAVAPALSPAAAPPNATACTAPVRGTDGPDELRGTSRADAIAGLGGPDEIDGRALGDCIDGGDGDDRIDGGAGADLLIGGTGDDRLLGVQGDDRLTGGDGNDELRGDAPAGGDEDTSGTGGANTLDGGDGDDLLVGGPGADELDGGAGDDSLRSSDGSPDGVDCGPGYDQALVDANDRVTGCERVERVPSEYLTVAKSVIGRRERPRITVFIGDLDPRDVEEPHATADGKGGCYGYADFTPVKRGPYAGRLYTGSLRPYRGGKPAASWCPGAYVVSASTFVIDVGPEGGFDTGLGRTRLRVRP